MLKNKILNKEHRAPNKDKYYEMILNDLLQPIKNFNISNDLINLII